MRLKNLVSKDYPPEIIHELTDLLLEDNPTEFAKRASQVLRPDHFKELQRMFTSAGTVIGAEQGARLTQ